MRKAHVPLLVSLCAVFITTFLIKLFLLFTRVMDSSYPDFKWYYSTVRLLVAGKNPYNVQEWPTGEFIPLVSPPQAMVLSPLGFLDQDVAFLLFTSMNMLSLLFVAYVTFAITKSNTNVRDKHTFMIVLCTLSALLFLNTTPVSNTIGLAQLSGIVTVLFVFGLFGNNAILRGACLALGVALKSSFLPLGILIFFTRDVTKTVAFALLFLVLFCIGPALFGLNLTSAYTDYLNIFPTTMVESNSFAQDGASNRVDPVFFISPVVNMIIQGILLALLIAILIKDWGSKVIKLNQLFFASMICMTSVYHRVHDMILPMAILSAFTCIFYRHKSWCHFVISAGFLIFYLIPGRYIQFLGNAIGAKIGENSVIYLGIRYLYEEPLKTLFPLNAIIAALLVIYAGYLYFAKVASFNLSLHRKDDIV